MRINISILFIIIILISFTNTGFASVIEIEGDLVSRIYMADVDESTRYNFSPGITVEQNYLFNFTNKNTGYMLTGIDYHFFKMENSNASMQYHQFGLIVSYYFNKIFSSYKLKQLYPYVRFHTGYNLTELSTTASNYSKELKGNYFLGAGPGFGYNIGKGFHFRAGYMFDVHFFEDGFVFINCINMSIAYLF